MPGTPGTEEEILDRRNKVAELYLRHVPQREIAELVGSSKSTVNLDIAHIKGEWKAERIIAYDAVASEELPKLDVLERELFRQLAIEHVVVSEGHIVEGAIDEGAKRMVVLAILKVMEMRAKLVGTFAPTKQEVLVISDDLLEETRNKLAEERDRRLRLVS